MSAFIRPMLLAGVASCAVALGAARPARAADATAAQAASMESQVRDSLGSLLGPTVKLGDRPMQVTPSGDHYNLVVPISAGMAGAAPGSSQPIQLTGTARPGDNGTWIVENVKITSPLTFVMRMPVPPPAGADKSAPMPTVPVTYTANYVGMTGRIAWDPSFATPSTWTSGSQSITVHSEGGPAPTDNTIGPLSSVVTLRPAGPDRVDLLTDGSMQDYRINVKSDQTPLEMAIQRVAVTSALNGVSRAHGVSLLQAVTAVLTGMAAVPPAPGQPPKVSPELAKAILGALQDFASDFTLDEKFDGLIVKAQGQTVALDHAGIGFDAHSEGGLLRAGMTMAMEGLTLPNMPLGDMAALIPRRVTLHPVFGGVAVADLMRLANQAGANADPSPADIMALFSHGGITGGIDGMTVEVGGATFTGVGKVVASAPSPDALSATATITAENFDALTQKITAIPALAQQAVPVIVFIKGVGRTVDNKLVWDVSYKDSKLLINNVDLTAMTGGAGPAPAPTPVPPPALAPVPVPAPAVPGRKPAGRPLPSWAR